MTCIRFALLGSGFIGQVHAASLARHERTVLSMVADADPERAKALASRYGARAVTVAEAISSDAIDAVLIASSTPSHASLLEAAARAGKAIYCEKPIDLSLARAREVVEKVLPLGVPVTVGFNRRFDASHQQLRREIEAGVIGKIELVQMVCRASVMPPLEYLRSSGGQMRDQAIHFFDLLRFLTGDEVTTVAAMGDALALAEIAEFDDVDTSILMLRMRGGAMAQLDNTRRTGHGYDERISLLGSDGVLESGSQTTRGVTLWQGGIVLRASGRVCPLARRRRGGGPAGAAGRPAGAGHRRSRRALAAAGAICQRRTAGVKKPRMRSAYGAASLSALR